MSNIQYFPCGWVYEPIPKRNKRPDRARRGSPWLIGATSTAAPKSGAADRYRGISLPSDTVSGA
ncbi:MAG: hypothetical protein CMJ59_21770 [Planctomycetaceae bacterium]|nr:hypothetical protein [Planctomycetaceae bacterium]